ncbi:MAG: hypothetical protein ACE5G3_05565 [Gammaproteobacteria bacterium]
MNTPRLWFARLVTLYAVLIFCFLAFLYIFEPLEHIARFGIAASGAALAAHPRAARPGASPTRA